jgi:hypothetical protein
VQQTPVSENTPTQYAAPPAAAQPVAAPALIAPLPRPPQTTGQSQAFGQPQPLNGNAPTAYAPPPPQQLPPQQQTNYASPSNSAAGNTARSNAGPPPNAPDTVTVDGITYVNGQEPRALGTLAGPPQAASTDPSMTPSAPAPSRAPAYSTRSYAPADRNGGAPLPNDVIILPNGQMAVPNGQQ